MLIPRRQRQVRLLLLAVAALILFGLVGLVVLFPDQDLRQGVRSLVHAGLLHVLGVNRYDFRPTPDEQACFNGTAPRINAPGMPAAIPKVVHFGWAIDKPAPVPLMLWLAIHAAAYNLGPDTEIRFHYVYLDEENKDAAGPWWDDVRRRVTLVRHEPDYLNDLAHTVPPPPLWDVAHMADVLRLQILLAEGGIWLDTDALVLRPLDAPLTGHRDVVMAHEGGNRKGLTNAVILAKPGAPFLRRWYREYDAFDDSRWNYHSVLLPSELADANPDELCQLSPAAFFWPLWTEDHIAWMHEPLSPAQAADVAAAMERTGGALFEEQLVYHAWNHAAKKFVKDLTPARIQAEDTRFNMLVRRFVDMR